MPAAMPHIAPVCMLAFEGSLRAPLSIPTMIVNTGATSATPVMADTHRLLQQESMCPCEIASPQSCTHELQKSQAPVRRAEWCTQRH
jgi:hypothetical protein